VSQVPPALSVHSHSPDIILLISFKGNSMKKFLTATFIAGVLSTSVFAHHMAEYEDAGIYIPETSPHLLMEF
jgi:hypothetical protein